VLIVDDNATNREIVEHHVLAAGMFSACASNGLEALEQLRHAHQQGNPFGLALIDMKMPGMNGLQLADAMRAQGLRSIPRLIMLSSLAIRDMAASARARGFDACLSKPLRRADLYRCIASVMGAARAGAAPGTAPETQTTFGARVLVVEDNRDAANSLRLLLQVCGYEVSVAYSGPE